MDLRDGRYITPSTPATQVFFDTATPTTEGVIFDPNTPALADTLYVSSTNSSTWIYQDGSYITYTAPVVNNTEWYITGTTIDAGGNKTASIERTGAVVIRNTTATSDFNMYSGSKRLQFKSDSATVNQIVSYSSELQINSFSSNLVLKTNNLERLKIASTGAVTLNAAYALPTVAPTSGQVLGYLGAGTTQWTTPSSSSGIWGIANASGVYTYYATWALAVAAATSGQVIELFADITEATNTYILKNGVNVNGNGHTITATMTGATACLDDGGVAVICDISNITINKTTGKGVSITNTSSIITGNCILKGVDASSGSLVLYGQLSGWTITGSSRYPVDMYSTAILTNVYISTTDTSAVAISTNASTVKINNCVIKSSGSGITGASGGGIISNCTVNSNTIGISCATGEVNNCSIVTNTSQALSLGAGSTANDCYARSSAGIATGGTSTSYFNNCSIVSDANVLGTSTPNYTNCKMWSKADWVLNGGGGGKIIDCSLITGYNNAAGYCIRESTSNTYVVDCYLEVANSGATPIYSSATPTLYLKGNSVKGTTNFKSAGIVNGQTNTADAQGNTILN